MYQRWVYKVDPTRVNEFGQRGDGAGTPQGKDTDTGGTTAKRRRAKRPIDAASRANNSPRGVRQRFRGIPHARKDERAGVPRDGHSPPIIWLCMRSSGRVILPVWWS
eukprot:scaffold232477_cov33-Tisochrysis_lutea.AAC.4